MRTYQGTFITPASAAERSGYNEDYVRRLAKSGSFDAVRVGRNWLIDAQSFDAFVAKMKNLSDGRYGPRI